MARRKQKITLYVSHYVRDILDTIYTDNIKNKKKKSLSALTQEAIYRMYRDRAVYLNKDLGWDE